jgi:hypothetical protein
MHVLRLRAEGPGCGVGAAFVDRKWFSGHSLPNSSLFKQTRSPENSRDSNIAHILSTTFQPASPNTASYRAADYKIPSSMCFDETWRARDEKKISEEEFYHHVLAHLTACLTRTMNRKRFSAGFHRTTHSPTRSCIVSRTWDQSRVSQSQHYFPTFWIDD